MVSSVRTFASPAVALSPRLFADLSNDSYSTVNMGLDDGASPHSGRGSYIHSSASPPPYLSSHSPNPAGQGHFSYSDNIVYTPLGELQSLGQFVNIERDHKTIICSLPLRRQPSEFDVASAGEHGERPKQRLESRSRLSRLSTLARLVAGQREQRRNIDTQQ